MNDFKITITGEDLQGPAKLACVEAIIGTCFTNGSITSILKGVDSENECFIGDNLYAPVGLLSEDDYQAEEEITLLYSQIKLDPRKLIFEDVWLKIEGMGEMAIDTEDNLNFILRKDDLKLSPTWLKQNFKCEEP